MDISLDLERDEQDFISACIRKERWAQRKIYEDHYKQMLLVCMRYAKDNDEAQDIVHEGFIKVFRHITKYKPGTSLKAWIKRIMVNTSIDYYRKMSRRRTEDMETAAHKVSNAADAVSICGEKDVLTAIQTLSPAYRSVFNLYVIEGYSHKEIGVKLGITESTSRSNLVKARAKLREVLASKYEEYGKR